jgi:hypothetical protein
MTKGSIGTSMRLHYKKRSTPKRLQGWLRQRKLVIKYLKNRHSVTEAAKKFKLREETIYKMISSIS